MVVLVLFSVLELEAWKKVLLLFGKSEPRLVRVGREAYDKRRKGKNIVGQSLL